MADERTYPCLPCPEIDDSIAFYESLGFRLSVSNLLSGRDWELDEVPAVRGTPTHAAQIGTGHGVSTGKGQRCVALQ